MFTQAVSGIDLVELMFTDSHRYRFSRTHVHTGSHRYRFSRSHVQTQAVTGIDLVEVMFKRRQSQV